MGDPPSKWGRCYWVENNTAPGRSGRVRIKKHLRKSLRAPYLLLQLSLKSLGKRYNPINISILSFWKFSLEYLFDLVLAVPRSHGNHVNQTLKNENCLGNSLFCTCNWYYANIFILNVFYFYKFFRNRKINHYLWRKKCEGYKGDDSYNGNIH